RPWRLRTRAVMHDDLDSNVLETIRPSSLEPELDLDAVNAELQLAADKTAAAASSAPPERNGHPPVTRRVDRPDDDERPIPRPVQFGDFSARHQHLRHHIIDGIARAGETVNIISHTKIGKSWLAVMLML